MRWFHPPSDDTYGLSREDRHASRIRFYRSGLDQPQRIACGFRFVTLGWSAWAVGLGAKTIPDSTIYTTQIAFSALGKTDIEAVTAYRDDPTFHRLLRLKRVPSAEILRQRTVTNPKQRKKPDSKIQSGHPYGHPRGGFVQRQRKSSMKTKPIGGVETPTYALRIRCYLFANYADWDAAFSPFWLSIVKTASRQAWLS